MLLSILRLLVIFGATSVVTPKAVPVSDVNPSRTCDNTTFPGKTNGTMCTTQGGQLSPIPHPTSPSTCRAACCAMGPTQCSAWQFNSAMNISEQCWVGLMTWPCTLVPHTAPVGGVWVGEARPTPGLTLLSSEQLTMNGTGNNFEGGTVIRTDDGTLHMFTTDQSHGVVNTSLVYYVARPNNSVFNFVRKIVCCSSGDNTGTDARASLWAPMPVLDPLTSDWHLFYVQYRSAPNNASGWYSNFDGSIMHAVSSVSGRGGVGGPYVDKGLVLQPDAHSQMWEGLQGTDSLSPPYQLPNGTWAAFYGSAHTEIPSTYKGGKWLNGLATADKLGGQFERLLPSSLVNLNGGGSENPVVTWLPAPHNVYIAVFDDLFEESSGFGFTWSTDGLAWQTPGTVVPVPGGARTPLASIFEANGTLTVYYTAGGNVHRSHFLLSNL